MFGRNKRMKLDMFKDQIETQMMVSHE